MTSARTSPGSNSTLQSRPKACQRILADDGYVGHPFALAVEELLGAEVKIAKRNELHTFAITARRWVVERSFARIEKCRRLWKSGERKLNRCLQFISTLPSSRICSEDRELVLRPRSEVSLLCLILRHALLAKLLLNRSLKSRLAKLL